MVIRRSRSAVSPKPVNLARRWTGVAAWSATLLVPAGVGYALWSASGTGPGSSKAITAQDLTVSGGSATAQLYPGASGNVVFSVTNPNPYAVDVTAATLDSISAVTGIGCAATDFTLNGGTVTATSISANATATVVVSAGITMKTTAPDGCQGVTVTVTGTVTGTQKA